MDLDYNSAAMYAIMAIFMVMAYYIGTISTHDNFVSFTTPSGETLKVLPDGENADIYEQICNDLGFEKAGISCDGEHVSCYN